MFRIEFFSPSGPSWRPFGSPPAFFETRDEAAVRIKALEKAVGGYPYKLRVRRVPGIYLCCPSLPNTHDLKIIAGPFEDFEAVNEAARKRAERYNVDPTFYSAKHVREDDADE